MNKIYYYRFKRFNLWLLFNILFSVKMIYCIVKYPTVMTYPQSYVLIGCLFVSIAVWCYKYILVHPMAIVTHEGIKIDHCNILKWKDIEGTEEKIVYCGFQKMKVLILKPKQDIDYRYNFLQKHNCGFTPFSIPLYGILSKEDEKELVDLINNQIKENK